ncbi:MAG: M20/M25/M40 family metallo-hydrolase, partial [Simkaniaceae bacterium]|nr:M20/M25/M40 family metallo-hydrolase [Simkaniaceae bacterium]
VDMPGENQPGITLGARGIVTFDLECTASNLDLHSGSFGGMVMNPNRALADVLAKCYEENGSVAIPGFYEGITPLTKKERGDLFQDMDTEKVFQEFGIRAKICEEGFSTVESNWIRPTLEINGMQGGYTGSGIKTIIPAKAVAKLSCRLVPGQDPKEIGELVAQFLKKNIAQGIEIKIEIGGYGKSVRVPFESKIVEVVSTAFEDVYKDKCVKTLCGGSIPISADLEKISGAKTLLMGVGLAEDGIHAPNEHFGLDRLKQGFLVMTRIFELLSNG